MLLLCYCKHINKGILPADQEAAEVDNMSVEQSSMTSRDQDSTNESSQSDRPHLPPKTYQ